FYLGTAYEMTGDAAEAAKIFSTLLEKTQKPRGDYSDGEKTNRALFQQHLASAYQEMGETEKAIAIYEALVKEDPVKNARQVFLLINAYRVSRQLDKALQLGKQHFEKNPKDTSIGMVYARALADSGKPKEGADVLNRLISAEPANLDLYVNL